MKWDNILIHVLEVEFRNRIFFFDIQFLMFNITKVITWTGHYKNLSLIECILFIIIIKLSFN